MLPCKSRERNSILLLYYPRVNLLEALGRLYIISGKAQRKALKEYYYIVFYTICEKDIIQNSLNVCDLFKKIVKVVYILFPPLFQDQTNKCCTNQNIFYVVM